MEHHHDCNSGECLDRGGMWPDVVAAQEPQVIGLRARNKVSVPNGTQLSGVLGQFLPGARQMLFKMIGEPFLAAAALRISAS